MSEKYWRNDIENNRKYCDKVLYNFRCDHHKYHLNSPGIEPGFGFKQLETEMCQSNTETPPHFNCKNSGYIIERKNGFVTEKPLKDLQCLQRERSLFVLQQGKRSDCGAVWSCNRLGFCEMQLFGRV